MMTTTTTTTTTISSVKLPPPRDHRPCQGARGVNERESLASPTRFRFLTLRVFLDDPDARRPIATVARSSILRRRGASPSRAVTIRSKPVPEGLTATSSAPTYTVAAASASTARDLESSTWHYERDTSSTQIGGLIIDTDGQRRKRRPPNRGKGESQTCWTTHTPRSRQQYPLDHDSRVTASGTCAAGTTGTSSSDREGSASQEGEGRCHELALDANSRVSARSTGAAVCTRRRNTSTTAATTSATNDRPACAWRWCVDTGVGRVEDLAADQRTFRGSGVTGRPGRPGITVATVAAVMSIVATMTALAALASLAPLAPLTLAVARKAALAQDYGHESAYDLPRLGAKNG